MSLEGRLKAAR